ncbi:hypothetical protein C8J56DRAFT_264136 [Mycena floridula]|nr:hypothetical protein C8J56DRAFT_264136 [Mycena floridula]
MDPSQSHSTLPKYLFKTLRLCGSRSRTVPQARSSTSRFAPFSQLFLKKKKRATNSLFSVSPPATPSSNSESPSTLVLVSVLSIAGPLTISDAGWMVTDYVMFVALLASQPGFDRSRFQHCSIRDILCHFPDRTFIFGEAGCDRLQFPIPPCFFDHIEEQDSQLSAKEFGTLCICNITVAALQIKPGEKLILLLIGRGARTSQGEFLLCISTQSNRKAEGYISKRELEITVAQCQGDILLICNSCHSGALQSPRWQLICVPGPHELADALTAYVRGPAGRKQSLVLPFPRAEKRPYHDAKDSSTVTLVSAAPHLGREKLNLLAPDYSLLPNYHHLREGIDAGRCVRYQSDPDCLEEREIFDLVYFLYSRNIQSVVAQLIAVKLGWWSSLRLVSFISLEDAKIGKWIAPQMIENGIPLNKLSLRLLSYFDERMWSGQDRASVWWLAEKWDDAGRPKVSAEEWDEVVAEAAKDAHERVLVKSYST